MIRNATKFVCVFFFLVKQRDVVVEEIFFVDLYKRKLEWQTIKINKTNNEQWNCVGLENKKKFFFIFRYEYYNNISVSAHVYIEENKKYER